MRKSPDSEEVIAISRHVAVARAARHDAVQAVIRYHLLKVAVAIAYEDPAVQDHAMRRRLANLALLDRLDINIVTLLVLGDEGLAAEVALWESDPQLGLSGAAIESRLAAVWNALARAYSETE